MRRFLTLCMIAIAIGLYAQNATENLSDSYDFETIEKYDTAIKSMLKVYETDPGNTFYNLRLGWLYYANGQYSQSEMHYNQSLESEWTMEAQQGRLYCAYEMEKWSTVAEYGQEILKKYPNDATALSYVGYAYFKMRENDKAANYYRKYLSIYPYNLNALTYLVTVEMRRGNRQAAENTYRKLKAIYPGAQEIETYAK